VSTALQSEERAFESLYRLNRPPVYAFALSRLRHPADAEDATQTTFLNAYCALNRGVTPRDDLQWLLAIARNVCHDRFRDAKRRPSEEPLDDFIHAVPRDDPEFSVRDIAREISELNPRHRQILLMREFEGRSYAEISTQLGVSEAAVQTLLARARRALRDEFELGMTCAHARRAALRNMNGVALREERRALKRHLRRCAECAVFVGQRPRTPVAQLLWLATMPYRRIAGLVAGTSAGQASGTTAAVAVKLATVAVVGTAAVGVTANELAVSPGDSARIHNTRPVVPPPLHSRAVSPSRVTLTPAVLQVRSQLRWTAAKHLTAREAPYHAPVAVAIVVPAPGSSSDVASAPSTPHHADTPATVDPPATNQSTAPPPQDGSGSSAATSTDGATPPAPAASNASDSTPAPTSAASATDPTAASTAPASDPTPTSPSDPTPATTPSPPTSNAGGQASPPGQTTNHGNAVGQGGTPPGQAQKPDVSHGRP
jgi:RNA polymerase sigma-70 factor, ECF subfamily